jgi:hypothetical protein
MAFLGGGARNVSAMVGQMSCELSVEALCTRTMASYLAEQATEFARAKPRKGSPLVPSVVPLKMPNGELAAEVECNMSVGAQGPWLVDARLTIQPSSQQAVDYLLDQELCTDTLPERSLAPR